MPDDSAAKSQIVSPTVYVLVYVALLLLLGVTVCLAYIDLGKANLPLALSVASLKAGLVGAWFMHLIWMRPLNRLVASVAVVWLAILLAGTYSDYATRHALDTHVSELAR